MEDGAINQIREHLFKEWWQGKTEISTGQDEQEASLKHLVKSSRQIDDPHTVPRCRHLPHFIGKKVKAQRCQSIGLRPHS